MLTSQQKQTIQYWVVCFIFLMPTFSNAQIFSEKGGKITDYQGNFFRNFFPIKIDGLPSTIDCSFGLESVCVEVNHARVSDLKISLMSPDATEVWLTNRNGGEDGRNYWGTCFRNNGFNGFIYDGIPPFKGEYIPDGRMALLNNTQNPNGIWYLIVEDLRGGEIGEVSSFQLNFTQSPPCESQHCDLNEIGACQCPDGQDSCWLLPDLVILGEVTRKQISFYPKEHPDYPNQLRLGVGMANIGAGPMEIRGFDNWYCGKESAKKDERCGDGSLARQVVEQVIYRKDGDKTSTKVQIGGTLYFDEKPGHHHYHADGWVDFILLKKRWWSNNPKRWKVVGKSEKVSYCLFDSNMCNDRLGNCEINGKSMHRGNLPNFGLGQYTTCDSGTQGISVGGVDYYGMLYEGQFIQLPDKIKKGKYFIYLVVDPHNFYLESDENNNTFLMPIEIPIYD